MRFIDASQIHDSLDYRSLVSALAQAHRRDMDAAEHLLLEQPGRTGGPTHLLVLPAWQRHEAIGVKLVTVFPDNTRSAADLPCVQGLYVLFDGDNGTPTACIDGAALTLCKTAADSALGASFLARSDVESMLLVGAGALAPDLIKAHIAVRPSIRHVQIWNHHRARADALARSTTLHGVSVRSVGDLEAAARSADLLCCATRAREPLVRGDWLKPGAHLDLVGGYTPDMREADDTAVRRASVFVDSRRSTLLRCGDICGPIAAGVIGPEHVLADHYDLCRGAHPGRRHPDEVTLFKNGGGGHLDLMTARHLLSRLNARASGAPV